MFTDSVADTSNQQHLQLFDHNLFHKPSQLVVLQREISTRPNPGYQVFFFVLHIMCHVMSNPIKDRKKLQSSTGVTDSKAFSIKISRIAERDERWSASAILSKILGGLLCKTGNE